jgi:hypothetical protein
VTGSAPVKQKHSGCLKNLGSQGHFGLLADESCSAMGSKSIHLSRPGDDCTYLRWTAGHLRCECLVLSSFLRTKLNLFFNRSDFHPEAKFNAAEVVRDTQAAEVVLKSGNFGDDDFFEKAVRMLP